MTINFKRLEEISRSLRPVYQTGKNFHVTFVYNKNKLICTAFNDYSRMHPYHKWGQYKNTKTNGEYKPCLHSELKAIIKMGLEDCSKLTFVNVRIDNNNKPRISRPCPNCMNILESVQYKRIWYFDGKRYVKL